MRHRLVAPLLLAAVVGLGACGDSEPRRTAPDAPAAGSPLEHRPEDVQSLVLPEEVSGVVRPWTGDLDGMIERKLVRVAVARGGFFYYINRGRQHGLTSEALSGFEDFLNRHLELKGTRRIHVVALPMTRDQILPAVTDGVADIAAGGLTITPERSRLLDFSAPWMTGVREIVVTGPVSLPIEKLDDLSGREVVVRVSSSYFESLLGLNEDLERRGLAPIDIIPAHEIFEAEDLLEMASVGMIGITISDDYIARFWGEVFPELSLRPDLVVREAGDIAWGFRKGSPQLREAIDTFVEETRPGTLLGNIVTKRYLENPERVVNALSGDRLKELSLEAPYFRKYADRYGFDWLQLAAQAFQESRLSHATRSPAGAVGIMQVLPQTARLMKVNDYASLEGNIHAGAKYMRYLADHYFPDESIDPMNRWLFALAGYNAGGARISRLREKARRDGRDPNRWFGEVEQEVAARIGSETVNYVRNVMKYYLAYRMTFEREQLREDVLSRLTRTR
jgi:membrane-bound lytic murein transglycosylase MltF